MKRPRNRFLIELAKALQEGEHQNVAEHLMAGALFAMYPEWFEKEWKEWVKRRQ
jgi:hypothetical protein